MFYCSFKYRIDYEDAGSTSGWTPYTGPALSKSDLICFVLNHLLTGNPVKRVIVFDLFELSSKELWLAFVSRTIEYRFLCGRGVSGFNSTAAVLSRN